MSAFTQLSALLGDLTVIARKLNYPASSICVLEGDLKVLGRDYPETASNLISCSHNMDDRSAIVYGQDLVASWIYEDYLMHELKEAGLEVTGAGADKNREILRSNKVSTDSDCLVSFEGHERGLELMNDHKGYWEKYHKFHLRDNKYQKILNTQSIFLGVSTFNGTYFLIDDISAFPAKFSPYHFSWHKPAQELTIPKDALKPVDFTQIAQDIKAMLSK